MLKWLTVYIFRIVHVYLTCKNNTSSGVRNQIFLPLHVVKEAKNVNLKSLYKYKILSIDNNAAQLMTRHVPILKLFH